MSTGETASPIDFGGQVAVVTGAGRGIGRAYAALLAARGARVVVNDLGVSAAGDGQDCGPAREVVESIGAAGGTAVADGSDVSTADGAATLVQHAMDAFGRIDILVLNAGIFGLDSFPAIEFDDVQRFLGVHVGGSFHVVRAAWPALEKAGYGRIVLTTSTSTFGAADTVAYATAKSAVLGLGRALSHVGADLGIKVNLIAPQANTRMMAIGMGLSGDVPSLADPARAPELVAPLVALLAHETCPTTGEVYMAGQRRYSRIVSAETEGYTHPGAEVTPEELRTNWNQLVDPAGMEVLSGVEEWSRRNRRFLEKTPVGE